MAAAATADDTFPLLYTFATISIPLMVAAFAAGTIAA
jgi:hypothetical protein